jgi:regulator of sigma E protease
MTILKFLFICLEVVVLFNFIIIVHELGHFLAAKWRGLHVERFGIWFGKPLWEKEIGGVHYSLGSIPAGGFVALPQMAPMEVMEGEVSVDRSELPEASALDKIIVAFAGPLFSMLLALFFAVVIWVVGRPVQEAETSTLVGYVAPDSPAAKAGVLPGDEILKVDGAPVDKFSGIGSNSVKWQIITSTNDVINLEVKRGESVLTFDVEAIREKTEFYQRQSLKQINVYPLQTAFVGNVMPGSPAEKAGIEVNDIIDRVNGEKIYNPAIIADKIREGDGAPIYLDIRRGDTEMSVKVIPEKPSQHPSEDPPLMLGVQWDPSGISSLAFPGPVTQMKAAVNTMVNTLGALFNRNSDIKAQHLSGPANIMRMYYMLFESDNGWRLALWFSVVFNVNLAILNMLPIPVLDGGHITLAIIEGIRRKPINPGILVKLQGACGLALIGFMLYVTFYDVQDFSIPSTPVEIRFDGSESASASSVSVEGVSSGTPAQSSIPGTVTPE